MEIADLQKKIVRGFFGLILRKILIDGISFVTLFIVLARVLPISVIGIYGIAQSILGFFNYFSDVGLAASLIQKKEISRDDLKTTFFIQESLVLLLTAIIFFGAPTFATFYHLDTAGMWLIRALGIRFFLTSLKSIPSTLLERKLNFEPGILVEVLEVLTFNGLLVYLTLQNFGVWSYSWAAMAAGVVGAVAINIIAPWPVGFGYSKSSAKELFNFGIPFQLNSLMALLKDRLTPLITARIIGQTGVGYLTWAQGIAYRPLEVMNIVIRITFPAFSRLQNQQDELKKMIEKSLFVTNLLVMPLIVGIVTILPSFISFMGKDKFEPAIPLIYLFAFSAFWAAPSTIFTNVLNAVGKVGITFKLMIMWTALTWILSPILALQYGYFGVALASAIISLSSIVPIMIVTRMIKVDIWASLLQPLSASLVMGLGIYLLSNMLDKNLLNLLIIILAGGLIYLAVILLMAKEKIILAIKDFKNVN